MMKAMLKVMAEVMVVVMVEAMAAVKIRSDGRSDRRGRVEQTQRTRCRVRCEAVAQANSARLSNRRIRPAGVRLKQKRRAAIPQEKRETIGTDKYHRGVKAVQLECSEQLRAKGNSCARDPCMRTSERRPNDQMDSEHGRTIWLMQLRCSRHVPG
eukprot:6177334-Pleurochrysis_carterae.AAC.3